MDEDIWFDSNLATDVIKSMRDWRIGPFRDANLKLNDSGFRVIDEQLLSTAPTTIHNMTLLGDYWSDRPRRYFGHKGKRDVSCGALAHGEDSEAVAWIGDRVTGLRIITDLQSSSFRVDEITLLVADSSSGTP
ncbi:MAG: hypothetical protein JO020_21525 [Chloroflexi bacterium]|nr:hypothetical protein [Chloroflexota bacterium]MBV9896754.1 hypothetical protein [Chloroflexota bacterium]